MQVLLLTVEALSEMTCAPRTNIYTSVEKQDDILVIDP